MSSNYSNSQQDIYELWKLTSYFFCKGLASSWLHKFYPLGFFILFFFQFLFSILVYCKCKRPVGAARLKTPLVPVVKTVFVKDANSTVIIFSLFCCLTFSVYNIMQFELQGWINYVTFYHCLLNIVAWPACTLLHGGFDACCIIPIWNLCIREVIPSTANHLLELGLISGPDYCCCCTCVQFLWFHQLQIQLDLEVEQILLATLEDTLHKVICKQQTKEYPITHHTSVWSSMTCLL